MTQFTQTQPMQLPPNCQLTNENDRMLVIVRQTNFRDVRMWQNQCAS